MDNQKINELKTRLSTQYGTNLRSRIRKLKEEITDAIRENVEILTKKIITKITKQ